MQEAEKEEENNMLKVYCYSRCTTCKKALKWLEDHGIEHTGSSAEAFLQYKRYSLQGTGTIEEAAGYDRG